MPTILNEIKKWKELFFTRHHLVSSMEKVLEDAATKAKFDLFRVSDKRVKRDAIARTLESIPREYFKDMIEEILNKNESADEGGDGEGVVDEGAVTSRAVGEAAAQPRAAEMVRVEAVNEGAGTAGAAGEAAAQPGAAEVVRMGAVGEGDGTSGAAGEAAAQPGTRKKQAATRDIPLRRSSRHRNK